MPIKKQRSGHRRTRAILAVAGMLVMNAPGQNALVSIRGQVVSESGKALPGITITYQRVPNFDLAPLPSRRVTLRPGERIVSGSVTTDNAGSYNISGAPAGRYIICAPAGNLGYLDPCRWSVSLSVTAAADIVAPAVSLKQGHVVTVHMKDQLNLLKGRAPLSALGVSVGALTKAGAYHPASATLTNVGFDLQITVPFQNPPDLWIHSNLFSISDVDNLASVPQAGGRFPIDTSRNLSERSFAVIGKR